VHGSIIGNYKPTLSIFRQLTREARHEPRSFTSRDEQPKQLSARVVRHPISPLARIWSALIRNTAAANAVLAGAERDWTRVDFENVYAARDLQVITNSYFEIPAGVRPLLLVRVMYYAMTQAAIWTKREQVTPGPASYLIVFPIFRLLVKALRATLSSVFRLLTLLVNAEEQIEVRIYPPVDLFNTRLRSSPTNLDSRRAPKDHGRFGRASLARQTYESRGYILAHRRGYPSHAREAHRCRRPACRFVLAQHR